MSTAPRQQRPADRLPRPVPALFAAGFVGVGLMGLAPQVGSLDPRGGFTDAIATGTDGTAHFQSPETDRAADAQLLWLRPKGADSVTVRLRMASPSPAWLPGCRVEIVLEGGATSSAASGCGVGRPTGGPDHEIHSDVNVPLPQGKSVKDIKRVRVMWTPPAYLDLPAV